MEENLEEDLQNGFVFGFHRSEPGLKRPQSQAERIHLAAEAAVAKAYGLRWEARGPPPPDGTPGAPKYWKGQVFRTGKQGGKQRWGNRGGKHQAKYAALAREGKLKPTPGRGTLHHLSGSSYMLLDHVRSHVHRMQHQRAEDSP